MTKKELSQLYYLKKEIKEQQRRLSELEALATSCSKYGCTWRWKHRAKKTQSLFKAFPKFPLVVW